MLCDINRQTSAAWSAAAWKWPVIEVHAANTRSRPISRPVFARLVFKRLTVRIRTSMTSLRDAKKVHFELYIVVDRRCRRTQKKATLTDEGRNLTRNIRSVRCQMGAEAIKELLMKINVANSIEDLRGKMKESLSRKKVEVFQTPESSNSMPKSGNNPEWMILDVIRLSSEPVRLCRSTAADFTSVKRCVSARD